MLIVIFALLDEDRSIFETDEEQKKKRVKIMANGNY